MSSRWRVVPVDVEAAELVEAEDWSAKTWLYSPPNLTAWLPRIQVRLAADLVR